jgi:predicted nuclease of predicted toxin-antitoxin system
MRLLLDNNLSPRLVELLTLEGWDVAHVRAVGVELHPEALFVSLACRLLWDLDADEPRQVDWRQSL